MKKPLLFLLLILNQGYAQWQFKVNKNEKKINAIGEVKFSIYTPDTIVLNLSRLLSNFFSSKNSTVLLILKFLEDILYSSFKSNIVFADK